MFDKLKQGLLRRRVQGRGGRSIRFERVRYVDISDALADAGVNVVPYEIDLQAFASYLKIADYANRPYYGFGKHPASREKWLEHYVSLDLLAPKPGEVLVDIASSESPFSDILSSHYGVDAYRQDWLYPDGVNGRQIGGDASALPVDDGFADCLVMHCSFEHFEGDRDSAFTREASRVLRPGGRLCILPLYTAPEYCIQTDPAGWKKHDVAFEADALICVTTDWGESHGRFYDAASFVERIVRRLGDLELTVYSVSNFREAGSVCYLRLAAVFKKPS